MVFTTFSGIAVFDGDFYTPGKYIGMGRVIRDTQNRFVAPGNDIITSGLVASASPIKLTARRDLNADYKEMLGLSQDFCKASNILCYSAKLTPCFDKKKNRVSKGDVFTTPQKHLSGVYDDSAITPGHNGLMFRCGSRPQASGFIALDIDVNGSEKAEDLFPELLERLTTECGLIVRTASGGLHLYWRLPEGVKYNKVLKMKMFLGFITAVGKDGSVPKWPEDFGDEYEYQDLKDGHESYRFLKDAEGRLDILSGGSGIFLPGTHYTFEGKTYEYTPIKGTGLADATLLPDFIAEEFADIPDMKPPEQRVKLSRNSLNDAVVAVMAENVPDTTTTTTTTTNRSASPLKGDEEMKLLTDLLDCLTGEWVEVYENWRDLCFAMRNVAPTSTGQALLVKVAQRSPRHRTEQDAKATREKWSQAKPDGTIGIGSIYYWAKLCNPEKYLKCFKDNYENLLLREGRIGHSNVFITELAGSCMYSEADKRFWLWLEHKKLWASVNEDSISTMFMTHMPKVCERVRLALPQHNIKDEECPVAKKARALLKLQAEFGNGCPLAVMTALRTNLNPLVSFRNLDAFEIDKNPDYLPLENGVWNFRESRLEPYSRTHYISKRLPVAYNPDADTSTIEKAMSLWFKGNKETISFLQYWLGYMITGHTARQDFLIVYGQSAGNGKTTLFQDIIQKDILTSLFATSLSEDALTQVGGNNDDIYFSFGKRLAIISEAGETKHAKELNISALKRCTGEDVISVSAKYKNKVEGVMTAKPVFICNKMPKMPGSDKAIKRRAITIEQNVKFVYPGEWDELTEEEKASGDYGVRNPTFIKALRDNKEGNLKWLLQGAKRYIENPLLTAPTHIRQYTEECIDSANEDWAWFKTRYIFDKQAKTKLSFKDVATAWCEFNGYRTTDGKAKGRLLELLRRQMGDKYVTGDSHHGYILKGVAERPSLGEED